MDLLAARIPARLEEVDNLGPRLTAAAAPVLTADRLFALELAVVEALTNIIRHGAPGSIDLVMRHGPDGVEVVLSDDGPAPPADLFTAARAPQDPLAESGRGLGLILACADGVTLTRDGARNVLSLRFGGG